MKTRILFAIVMITTALSSGAYADVLQWSNPVLSRLNRGELLRGARTCRLAPTRGCRPDIIVSQVRAGAKFIGRNGMPRIRLSVTVMNIGLTASPAVKVALTGSHQDGANAFSLPTEVIVGGPALMGAMTLGGAIGVAQTRTVTVNALFRASWSGQPIFMRAVSDSCVGDVGMPAFCRSAESVETNNESGQLNTLIP